MARPRKWRFLSPILKDYFFKPRGYSVSGIEIADLAGDELEAMRLCDVLELEQKMAGRKMGISRPTVQRLLYSGRKKVVGALASGNAIKISFPKNISFRRR
ncbi:MAG: DUF134 domain-containing protein [Candidatus Saganbacteria bacterium]|nr:DUF134 domain-containing protein [Candidatus Saganbacteria bacterium]